MPIFWLLPKLAGLKLVSFDRGLRLRGIDVLIL
jgi:hypothetical protein